jgi:diacylglycerol kinase family enzyme
MTFHAAVAFLGRLFIPLKIFEPCRWHLNLRLPQSRVLSAVVPHSDSRTVLISLNPRAGSRSCHDRVQAIGESLIRSGFDVRMTSDLAELASLAAEGWNRGNLRAVLAVGGDGTASVVRNHVPLAVPMVPVPMGTENLLGRYVQQSIEPAEVCRTISDGVVVGLDLCSANGKHFLLMVSAGFDAEVIRVLHENRRGNITRRSYFLPTLRTIGSYRFPKMRLYSQADGASGEPHDCRWMFGFNLPLYALGLPIAPDASAADGLLDVCTFQRGKVASVFRYLWHVQRRTHSALEDAVIMHSRRFRLEAHDSPNIPYQIDGDFGGMLPVDVEVLPGDLRLLVSPMAAARLGFALPQL